MPRVEAGPAREGSRTLRRAGSPALSRTQAPARQASRVHEWLTFRSGAEEYGIDNALVREIRAFGLPAREEGGDALIAGVAIVQGVVLTIADLRTRAETAGSGSALTSTLVLDFGGRRLCMAVGAVGEVVHLRAQDILPAPSFPRGRDTAHVVGIATPEHGDRRRTIVLVDIQRWLSARSVLPR